MPPLCSLWLVPHPPHGEQKKNPNQSVGAFEYEFERVMTDPQKYYGYMARDIYIAGLVLRTKKYRYLRWSYQSLMMGVGLGVITLLVQWLI